MQLGVGGRNHGAMSIHECSQPGSTVQDIIEHRAKLARGIEDDGDAADAAASLQIAHPRRVDIGRLPIAQGRRGKRGDSVALRVLQACGQIAQVGVHRAAHQRRRTVVGRRPNRSRSVEGHDARIDGIEAVDVGENTLKLTRAVFVRRLREHPPRDR